MSKLSVISLDGMIFVEDYNSDTGECFYVADRPFIHGNRYVDALDLDAFWRWVGYISQQGFERRIKRLEILRD
jgi:hypothetical protein